MNNSMKKGFRKSLATGGVVLSLCGTALVGVQVAVMIQHPSIVRADQVAPSTTNITVHKMMYDTKDAKFFEQNKIKNDGTDKSRELPDQITHYNPNTMGKVEFTLYDITDVVNEKFNDGKGLTGWTNSAADQQAMNGRVKYISESIQKSFNNAFDATHGVDPAKLTQEMSKNEYLAKAQKVATKAINSNGDVTFENVKAYDASKQQKYHYYAAVETKTPRGFVTPPSEPIIFVNPYTNPDGTGFLSTTHLYPKNKTQKLNFDLTKYVLWNADKEGGKKVPLAGAKFQLYRGEPGKGEKVGGVLTTDSKGKVTANNLIMGKYYFVEEPSEVAGDEADDQARAAISPIAKNDVRNKLTFEIGEDGIDPTKLQGSLVNYGPTNEEKKLTNGIGPNQSLHRGDFGHFNSKTVIPQNIMGSAWQIDATGTKSMTEPYHTFFTHDEPDDPKELKDVPAERHLVIKTPDGKVLEEGKDYQILNGSDSRWYVNYVVKGLSEADAKKLQDAANSHDNKKIEDAVKGLTTGSVSDLVAAQAGKKLTYDYDEVLTDDTPLDKRIVNNITLGWNDGSGYKEIHRHDDTVTYGVNFVKESSGFMGWGFAKQKLEGAQFAVQDLKTGKWFNGFKENSKKGEKDIDWVDNYSDVKAGILTSDKEGKFALQGFSEGDYKLREVKAPKGYQLMNETVNFKIGPHTNDQTLSNPIEIKNDEKTSMPFTGSQGLLQLGGILVAVVVVGGGTYIYVSQKKKKADK
ncbi:pilin N-terminal domain-containing protein [Lactobacillus gasseri]|uniref:Pilin N-terminal domain-containing protein n=2 Tax=Limosilactobacillus vaginalis TaxID=1633 RepID=A0ABT4K6B8_9LACO|nr:pilin N-terminal domain-containing protein [Lactobacillus gasseri]MCZ3781269.1 pilin N-terminal domain-containing protein [Limosilactobacillus vaginalis]MCZ3761739.1 pilin N-terminal domain-containing protein [Lactobacillus gasseri]MCZ3765437.1 pilin N-terminal domain-containing protein [Lactobacillus gasseri]MCZ3766994.1 pilin N-terminal domain-containing protein [Lactobacillus gasseri]